MQIILLLVSALIVNASGFGGFGLGLFGNRGNRRKTTTTVAPDADADAEDIDGGDNPNQSSIPNAERPIRDGIKKIVPAIKELTPAFVEMAPSIVSIISASSKLINNCIIFHFQRI